MGFSYTAKNTILNGMTGRSQYATLASTCMIGVGVMEGDVFTEPDATTGYNRTLLGNYQSADSKCMGEPVQGNIRNTKIIYLPEAVADWGTVTHFGLPPVLLNRSSPGNSRTPLKSRPDMFLFSVWALCPSPSCKGVDVWQSLSN